MDKNSETYKNLQRFANEHKLVLEDKGEIGFGRPCVGFLKGSCYVGFNSHAEPDYKPIEGLQDDRLYAPEGVTDAYHKHDCLAVLAHSEDYDEALRQLNKWIVHIESLGTVEIAEYPTGASGMQAMISGIVGHAVTVK